MIITSEHDFSSANTYIHPGYASAQNSKVATHETLGPRGVGDRRGGGCYGGYHGLPRGPGASYENIKHPK